MEPNRDAHTPTAKAAPTLKSTQELIEMGLSPQKFDTPLTNATKPETAKFVAHTGTNDQNNHRTPSKETRSTIKDLIEMGLTPQKYIMQTTARTVSVSQENLLTKDNVIRQLSKEPGVMYELHAESDRLLIGTNTSRKYDPYSFLDKMAMPFDPPKTQQESSKTNAKSNPLEGNALFDAVTGKKKPMPHCKACTDFKTWMELTANPRRNMSKKEREEKECPLDSALLGSNTWSFLHSMAAYYPEKPSAEQQHKMKSFIKLLADFYPCHKCAAHLREDLKTSTPDTSSNKHLSNWFCELHNRVNVRLGKAEFDCSKVLERWRDGWADGTCD